MYPIEVKYSPKGIAVADADAHDYALKAGNENIHVSTENVIMWVRVHIKEGRIKHEQIYFMYNRHLIHPNSQGKLYECPEGFGDCFSRALDRLLNI